MTLCGGARSRAASPPLSSFPFLRAGCGNVPPAAGRAQKNPRRFCARLLLPQRSSSPQPRPLGRYPLKARGFPPSKVRGCHPPLLLQPPVLPNVPGFSGIALTFPLPRPRLSGLERAATFPLSPGRTPSGANAGCGPRPVHACARQCGVFRPCPVANKKILFL